MKKILFFIFISLLLISCDKDSTTKELGFADLDENNDFDWAVDEATDEATDEVTDEVTDETTDEVTDETTDETTDEVTDETDDEVTDETVDNSEIADDSDLVDEDVVDEDFVDEDLVDENLVDEDIYIPENVIFVKHDATGLNDGSSWANAYTDLSVAIRYLIENHIEGKDIWVSFGTYHPTDCPNHYSECNFETPQRRYHFTLLKGIGIYGGFTGIETDISQRDWKNNETILSGDFNNDDETMGNSENAYHVFYHDGWEKKDNTAILDGFTITGGNADSEDWPDEDGGGIRNNKWPEFGSTHTAPVIRNCTFKNNHASGGGAMYNHEGASPIIENCTFINNTAGKGGAIYNYLGSPVILNSTFSENNASAVGGAIAIDESDVTIDNCTFSNNSAVSAAGAVFIKKSSGSTIKNSLFSGNTATNGGAVSNTDTSVLKIESCYFYNNTANGSSLPSGLGGGLLNQQSTATVINSVFKGNSAVAGGAVANLISANFLINCSIGFNAGGGIVNGTSNPEIINTIIYDNSDYNIQNIPEGAFGMGKSTPAVSFSNIGGCGGSSMTCGDGTETCWVEACGTDNGNNIDEDPLFINSGDDPLNLADLSPCIDAGDSTKIPVTITKDVAGNDRIKGIAVDMGAYEVK